MTVKVYYSSKSRCMVSVKKVELFLQENKVYYEMQNIEDNPLTWEQLLEILMCNEEEFETLLSTRSTIYKQLIKDGMDFEDIKLSDFHKIVEADPTLLVLPITVGKNTTLVGYAEENMSTLKNRFFKKKDYFEALEIDEIENGHFEELYA